MKYVIKLLKRELDEVTEVLEQEQNGDRDQYSIEKLENAKTELAGAISILNEATVNEANREFCLHCGSKINSGTFCSIMCRKLHIETNKN